jgi:hypothetical protein
MRRTTGNLVSDLFEAIKAAGTALAITKIRLQRPRRKRRSSSAIESRIQVGRP